MDRAHILYFADDISSPSVLWMRRMLDGLGGDVSILVTETDPGPAYAERYETLILRDGSSRLAWSLARRMGLIESIPKTRGSVRPLLRALESGQVTCALVHYLASAVEYRRLGREHFPQELSK